MSENTIKVYFTFVADFVAFIESKSLDGINNTDVRLFVEQQVTHKKYSISTHRQLVSAINHFGCFLPDNNLKVSEIPRPSRSKYLPTVLSKEEVIDILRATNNLKHKAIIALLYSAGLRVGEVIDLELKYIDIDRLQVFIKNGKGRKDRVVVLAESFIPLYLNYYMTYQPKLFFIESPTYGKYSLSSIRNFLKRSCRQAGFIRSCKTRNYDDLYSCSKKDLLKIQSPLDTALIALSETDKGAQNKSLSDNISR